MSQAATCSPIYHTRWSLHVVRFISKRQTDEAINTHFYSFCLGPTGNRTRV